MEATIKETVKNIFKTNTFEVALDLTREYRGEYIKEFGAKSWNGIVTYYKNANIIPEEKVAEEEPEYHPIINEPDEMEDESSEPMTDEGFDAIADNVAELESEEEADETYPEEETIDYMLYQNDGDKVDWYGHFVNYKGLKVGDVSMMVRMNNLGVGMGKVLATAKMTMTEIGEFHKCYAAIRTSVASDNRRVVLFKRAFNNLQAAMKDPAYATKTTAKAKSEFVLNYDSDK